MKDASINTIAEKIRSLGLTDVCLFMIEAHLPLRNMIFSLSKVSAPITTSVWGLDRHQKFEQFFSDSKNLEHLAEELSS